MNGERYRVPGDKANPDLIRVILAGLRPIADIATPEGTVAIARDDALHAGLDAAAVGLWVKAAGGYTAVTYLRPAGERLSNATTRPVLHPLSYFVVPVEALATPDGDAET